MNTSHARRAVLFLPGLMCDDDLWCDQVAALADMAEPTVADLAGDVDEAAMARRALASAPPRFALVGHSMGGYVAFEMLRQAPERVTALALVSTSAASVHAARRAQRRGAIAALQRGRFLGVTNRLLPQLVHRSHLGGPLANRIKAMAARIGPAGFVNQQQAILSRPDSLALLPRIAVPVGDVDHLTPLTEAQRIHAGIAGSRMYIFAGCGHLPRLERPDETSALLRDWLATMAPDPSRAAAQPLPPSTAKGPTA